MTVRLKPFFCFYGGKWRAAPHYPRPMYGSIIEPFAGAAGYSTRYFDRSITLVDVDPVISGVWSYLIAVEPSEILALPEKIDSVDDVLGPQESKWLIGFWLNKGTVSPRRTPSRWMRDGTHPNSFWGSAIRERIASQVEHIRHWKVIHGDYTRAPDVRSTWFVDPPYDNSAGRYYSTRFDGHRDLGAWCLSRDGQVIVCENAGAAWMDFRPFMPIKANESKHGGKKSNEVIWTRDASKIEVPAETGQSAVVRPGPVAAPESGEPGVRMEPQLKRR